MHEQIFKNISETPILRERQLCQLSFVKAVKELEGSNDNEYINELKTCISYGPYSYPEQLHYLAKVELRAMNSS